MGLLYWEHLTQKGKYIYCSPFCIHASTVLKGHSWGVHNQR